MILYGSLCPLEIFDSFLSPALRYVLSSVYAVFLYSGADAHDRDGHVLLCARARKLRKSDDVTSIHTVSITARDLTIAGRFVFGERTCCGRLGEKKMADRSYAVLRSPSSNAVRLSWSPQSSGEMFCGICMRGLVTTEIGRVCPTCQSRVAQVFEVVNGGQPSSYRIKRRILTAHPSAGEPFAKVVSL